jgi:hypothetical protein
MSALTNVWRQLVQRRLWPVAILLIAALAAVPLALAEPPEPAGAPTPAVTAESGETALATQPIVAQATAADRSKRRKVLGSPKNPFGVPRTEDAGSAAAPNSNGSTTAQDATPDQTESNDGGTSPSSSGGGSPSTGGGSAPAPIAPATPAPAPKTYAMHELTVRFGDASGSLERKSLERLQPLPSAAEPVLIYLGVLKDGKTAVFLVDHGVSAIGDGDCRPSPEECETIRLRAGETEFLDIVDETGTVTAQYQLDLIKIHKSTTASASRAKASSKAGRRLLKARVSSEGPTGYRWDAAAGALERRPGQALRATVASTTVSLP